MFNYAPPYSFWSMWRYFSTSERLFFVVLGLIGLYAVFSLATALRVWKTKGAIQQRSNAEVEHMFVAPRRRCIRLRNLIGATFYLFGTVLFLNLQLAYISIDNSTTPGGWLVLQNFGTHFVFAFNVFFAFLILHIIAWAVSASVYRAGFDGKLEEL